MTNPPAFAGAESPAHPKAEQEFREEIKLPNPPLLGVSRDEIARIIEPHYWALSEGEPYTRWGYKPGPAMRLVLDEALAKADQILALPAFAGLLTPSLSHEEEDGLQVPAVRRGSASADYSVPTSVPSAAFTPGPWRIAYEPNYRPTNAERGLEVCCLPHSTFDALDIFAPAMGEDGHHSEPTLEEFDATARLIAAAPYYWHAAAPLVAEIALYEPSMGEDDDELVEVRLGDLKALRAAHRQATQTTPPTPGDQSRTSPSDGSVS